MTKITWKSSLGVIGISLLGNETDISSLTVRTDDGEMVAQGTPGEYNLKPGYPVHIGKVAVPEEAWEQIKKRLAHFKPTSDNMILVHTGSNTIWITNEENNERLGF